MDTSLMWTLFVRPVGVHISEVLLYMETGLGYLRKSLGPTCTITLETLSKVPSFSAILPVKDPYITAGMAVRLGPCKGVLKSPNHNFK